MYDKYFPRILRIRRKKEEHSERNLHFQQCLGTLKGQYFKKPEDEQFTNFIFWLSFKNSLFAYMENTHNGEKRRLKLSTSQLIMVQHEKNCRSFLSLMDGLY
jgi:hypothetical protein